LPGHLAAISLYQKPNPARYKLRFDLPSMTLAPMKAFSTGLWLLENIWDLGWRFSTVVEVSTLVKDRN
jgi:hypothetical protein